MPAGIILEEEFINYVCLPLIDLHKDTGSSVSLFQNKLRGISFKIRGESIRDFKEFRRSDPESFPSHLKIMIGKVKRAEKDLFDIRDDGVYYVHNNANLKINKNGRIFSNYAFWIFEYCQDIISIFEDQVEEIKSLKINERPTRKRSLAKDAPKQAFKRKERFSPKQSFELKNPDVNLT